MWACQFLSVFSVCLSLPQKKKKNLQEKVSLTEDSCVGVDDSGQSDPGVRGGDPALRVDLSRGLCLGLL